MHTFKKHIAVLLLLISTLFVLPKELLHELSCHEDTMDVHCTTTDGLAISTIHHHCDILQIFVQPYNAADTVVEFKKAVKLISHYSFKVLNFSVELVQRFVIRGPPTVS